MDSPNNEEVENKAVFNFFPDSDECLQDSKDGTVNSPKNH